MNTAPKFWKTKNILSTTLIPLGWLYTGLTKIRHTITTPYKASIPILCVGNVTVGGTGKTPLCMSLAQGLTTSGYKNIFIVSKGYGGTITEPTQVDTKKHTASDVGDEPLLMASRHNVVISKCRKSGVQFAEILNADYIIMDDGLQNPTVIKDKSIVVIDALQGFLNGRIFPSGALRECPIKPLKCADAIVLTTPNKDSNVNLSSVNLSDLLKKYDKKIYTAYFVISTAPFQNNDYRDAPQSVVAFAGIGNPDKFFESVRGCGYPIRATASYPDHHPYSDDDLESLHGIAKKSSAKLITTEKDFVRLSPTQQKGITALPITLKIKPDNLVENLMENNL